MFYKTTMFFKWILDGILDTVAYRFSKITRTNIIEAVIVICVVFCCFACVFFMIDVSKDMYWMRSGWLWNLMRVPSYIVAIITGLLIIGFAIFFVGGIAILFIIATYEKLNRNFTAYYISGGKPKRKKNGDQ